MARSRVDDELATLIRRELKTKGMLQKDLAAATDLTQAQVSRLLSGLAPWRTDYLDRICGVLTLDASEVLLEATKAAENTPDADPFERQRLEPREQARALGRQIAMSVWSAAGETDFIVQMLNESCFHRSDKDFWTDRRLASALVHALRDISVVLGDRYPVRDSFLYQELLSPEKVIG